MSKLEEILWSIGIVVLIFVVLFSGAIFTN